MMLFVKSKALTRLYKEHYKMQDISGFGLQVRIVATETFPSGFTITQFADDGDPFALGDQQIKDSGMGVNGDLVVWSVANPITITINVIPNSDDDKNLTALFEANRVGKGKRAVQDSVTMTAMYPDGKSITYSNGVITNGTVGRSVASAGRMSSKAFVFSFENKVGD